MMLAIVLYAYLNSFHPIYNSESIYRPIGPVVYKILSDIYTSSSTLVYMTRIEDCCLKSLKPQY